MREPLANATEIPITTGFPIRPEFGTLAARKCKGSAGDWLHFRKDNNIAY